MYSECVCVCVCVCVCCLSYPACKAHAPYCKYCHLRPVLLYHIFPRDLINGTIFGKTLLNIKCVLGWFSLQLLHEKFFTLRRIELVVIINVLRFLYKLPVILVIFNETRIFSKDFRKILKHTISWKSVQWETSCSMLMCREAGRQAGVTKLVTFHSFANARRKQRHKI
jgi:hypothetical protein